MKALLLAAGLGTRLKPFTFFRAKATLPLLDVPFIHYPLQYLHSQGITEVVINLHAHPESVRAAAGNEFKAMQIQYSFEPEILGTAGAMWKARDLLGPAPFAVLNGDMICNVPLQEMIAQHNNNESLVTLAVMDGHRFPQYGGLQFDERDPPVLAGFSGGEKKCHYTGLQIVNPEVIDRIPANQKSEIFKNVYPDLLSTRKINGYKYDGLWMEIGTLKEYLQTSMELLHTSLPENLRPPKMSNSNISRFAVIEDGALVEESIVMENAVVRAGARVRRSIIGPEVNMVGEASGVALARGILPWWIKE